ncbi:MAG: class I SAM-dependent methyltransferase [Bryobacteraceae bacterium]
MSLMKTAAAEILKRLDLYGWYSVGKHGSLVEDGWFRSFQEQRPVDGEGNPIPFITYPAIEFLKRRVRPEMTVLEYGSGMSTLWWASRVKQVNAVEHDRAWFERVTKMVPPNVTVHFASVEDKTTYPGMAQVAGGPFSVAVIDGRLRVRCARAAVEKLTPDGVVIWDNSDRDYYKPGYQFLAERGFRRLEFVGPCPSINEKGETSIFYREGNCLGI